MGAPAREGGEEGCRVGQAEEAGEKGEAGLRVARDVGDRQHNNQPAEVTYH